MKRKKKENYYFEEIRKIKCYLLLIKINNKH